MSGPIDCDRHVPAPGPSERAVIAAQSLRAQLDAVTVLAGAGADHHRAVPKRGQARLDLADEVRPGEPSQESHEYRPALTHPLTALRVLVPDPAAHAAARAMVIAAYDIRDAADSEAPNVAQGAARAVHDHRMDTAAVLLSVS
jgi:hypothetical protein